MQDYSKPLMSGPGICDGCGDKVKELMVISQEGGPEITAIANFCFCRDCAGNSWPNIKSKEVSNGK